MCLFSNFFCCNRCNNNRRNSLCQNVRMRCVDAGGADGCERQNDYSDNGCNRCDCDDCPYRRNRSCGC